MFENTGNNLGFHQVEVHNFIEREKATRVAAIHKQTLLMQTIFIVACAWVFSGVIQTALILTWLTLQLLVFAVRSTLTYWHFQIKKATTLSTFFTNASLVLCFLNSVLWGATAFILDFQQYPQESVFLITINLGIGIGSTGIGGYWLGYYLTYTITFMSLFALAFILGVPEPNLLLALIFLAFTAYLSKVVYVAYKGNIHNLLLRKQNEVLAKSRTDFLAAASHDLRQPLQALNLFLSALDKESSNNAQILKQVESSTQSLNELLNHMLDVSALDSDSLEVNIEPIELRKILSSLNTRFTHAAEQKHIALNIEITDVWVHADKVLLERAIANLIDNAIKYTAKGHVTISIEKTQPKIISIKVKDSGVGISEEQQQHIFDEFYQVGNKERNSENGVGLGLSIVKRICVLMNVDILIDSTLDTGSSFTLILQQADKQLATDTQDKKETFLDKDLSNVCALVIEDNDNVRDALCSQLKRWNMTVLAAKNLADVNQLISKAAPRPDIVLSDYRLIDCTGIEAVQTLITRYDVSYIPSIIISGDTAPEVIDHVKKHGYTLLHKPVRPAQLRAELQRKIIQQKIRQQ